MKTEQEIINYIKQDLLLGRLELADTGLTLQDISDDHLLLDDNGLGLDSVEALDLFVGAEKAYGFQTKEIDKAVIEKACHSVRSFAAFILDRIEQAKMVA